MTHVSYTQLRDNLASYMDAAAENRTPLLVTRQGGKGNVECGAAAAGHS
jgi:antitoxin YefM